MVVQALAMTAANRPAIDLAARTRHRRASRAAASGPGAGLMGQRCRTCDHPERSRWTSSSPGASNAKSRGSSASRSTACAATRIPATCRRRSSTRSPSTGGLSAEALAQLRADESAGVLLHLAQQRRLLRLQDEAESKKWRPLMVRAARELHRNVELTGRTLGKFAEHERAVTQVPHLQVLMSPEYVELRGGLIKAVAGAPEGAGGDGGGAGRLEGAAPHFTGAHPPKLIERAARMVAWRRTCAWRWTSTTSRGAPGWRARWTLAAAGAGGRRAEDRAQLQPAERQVDDGGLLAYRTAIYEANSLVLCVSP